MVLPEHLLKLYLREAFFLYLPCSYYPAKSFTEFIEEGYFEKHLNRMRNVYKKKKALFLSEIKVTLRQLKF